jgi:hypothetical protein
MSAQLLSAASSCLFQFKGHELAQFGWGLATMKIRVEQQWLEPWQGAVTGVLPQLTPQGLAMLLWATARLTEQQHMSVSTVAAAAAAMGDGSISSSSSSSKEWLGAVEGVLQQQLLQHGTHSLSICLWAMGKLGYQPHREVTGAALDLIQPQLSTASITDLAVLLCSLAALGYRPSKAWLAAHGAAVRRRLGALGTRRVSNLLWAHAKLGARPEDEGLLGDMVGVLHSGLQVCVSLRFARQTPATSTVEIDCDSCW